MTVALLVIDKQRAYFDPAVCPFSGAEKVGASLPAQDSMIQSARMAGLPVIWTRMSEGGPDSPQHLRNLLSSDTPIIQPGTPGYEFAGLSPNPDELIIPKSVPNAFSVPEIVITLKETNVDIVLLIGGYSGRCVLATAFGANEAGFAVVVCPETVEPHPEHEEESQTLFDVVNTMLGRVLPASRALSLMLCV